jgi:Ser/Thr protein kinase RdoA (MazF antagonist)
MTPDRYKAPKMRLYDGQPPTSVLRQFRCADGQALDDVTKLEAVTPGFSGARVWKVVSRGECLCVHRHPVERVSAQRCFEIATCLRGWCEAGLPVPRPCWTGLGDAAVTTGEGVWTVETWRPGVADYWAAPSVEKVENACRAIARLHAVSERWSLPGWGARTTPPVHLERRVSLWGELRREAGLVSTGHPLARLSHAWDALAPQVADVVLPAAARLATRPTSLTAVLRDVWHDHVLFTGAEVTGLVDPGACGIDSPMADLSRLLGSLVADDVALWRRGIGAYSEVRRLSSADVELLDAYDATSVLLSGSVWRGRVGGEDVPLDDGYVRRVEERWSRLLERLRGRLMGFRVPQIADW